MSEFKLPHDIIYISVWEVKFHPTSPDHLFSCSEDGSIWHWDASSVPQTVAGTGRFYENNTDYISKMLNAFTNFIIAMYL